MANVEDDAICATCGRPLPTQQGRGRQRRYCDATCRSAARRKRSRATDATPPTRKPSIDNLAGPTDIAAGLLDAARGFVAELPPSGRRSPLDAVASAKELARSVDAALRDTVDAARAAGHTWQEIGDVLGTTRQAAFQRFGRPLDPRSGVAMAESIMPEATELGVALLVNLIEGNYAEVRRDFDKAMTTAVGDDGAVAAIWAQLAGTVGPYERMGEPFAHQLGDYTAIDVPLEFEAGALTARVAYDTAGKVAGLRFLHRGG
ncbi:MAG TPA: DUF3887 domain-containing protein [Pseudonocardiaceae bacterium]|nr:DUF3887 domain-containing protein [Pseudonocardiaceae bacterium]